MVAAPGTTPPCGRSAAGDEGDAAWLARCAGGSSAESGGVS
jgi:hypothetical protein